MLYIYGASGHGKIVLHTFICCGQEVTAFIDDNAKGHLCGLSIISLSELTDFQGINGNIHIAIGNNYIRQRLQHELQRLGITVITVIHPNANCYSNTSIGQGSLLAAGSVVGVDSIIGSGCIINHNAVVDHDCKMGDFCHIAPSATLGGAVVVGERCLVGAGSVILPGLNIGNNVTIGAGAVVTHDLPDNVTVIGCPARPINTH